VSLVTGHHHHSYLFLNFLVVIVVAAVLVVFSYVQVYLQEYMGGFRTSMVLVDHLKLVVVLVTRALVRSLRQDVVY
jgi:hypothetical protein